jgi:hypothetical protein
MLRKNTKLLILFFAIISVHSIKSTELSSQQMFQSAILLVYTRNRMQTPKIKSMVLSLFLSQKTLCLHYEKQLANAVEGKNNRSLLESY